MSAPTRAQAWTQIKDVVKILDEIEKFGASNATNYVALYNTLIGDAIYDYGKNVLASVAAQRRTLGDLLSPSAVQAVLSGPLADMMAAIDAPERGPLDRALYRLREDMIVQVSSIKSREFTYGTVTALGSPTGNGTINRITVDEDGYNLDCTHSETKTLECVSDQGQTDKHSEVFEVRGQKPEMDLLSVVGSGMRSLIKALSTRDSEAVLVNPTFSQFAGTAPTAGVPTVVAAVDDITGWVLDSVAASSVEVHIDNAYRDLVNVDQTYSVKFLANRTITQTIETEKNGKFDIRAPYYLQVAIYRKDAATGTLTITFGNVTTAITIGGLSDNAWSVARMTLNKNQYYKNFKKNTMTVKFALTSLAVGTILLDDVICAPCQLVDGIYYAPVGGATPWMYKDKYTVADTQAAGRGKIAYWLWRTDIGISLPSKTDDTETIADPT